MLGLVVLIIFNTILMILCSAVLFSGELDIPKFLLLNFGLLALQIFIAAFCFMFTCIFSEIKYSVGLSGGLIATFIIMQMLSQVYDNAKILVYCNPLSLFNPQQLANGNMISIFNMIILWVLSIICLLIGLLAFRKKDLSI